MDEAIRSGRGYAAHRTELLYRRTEKHGRTPVNERAGYGERGSKDPKRIWTLRGEPAKAPTACPFPPVAARPVAQGNHPKRDFSATLESLKLPFVTGMGIWRPCPTAVQVMGSITPVNRSTGNRAVEAVSTGKPVEPCASIEGTRELTACASL